MAEELRTHMDGVGGEQGETLRAQNNKFWYPFEPDVIEGDMISSDNQEFRQPGGHIYATGAKSGVKGTYFKPWIYANYDGSKKPEHIHHKYSIFAGETNYSKLSNMNRYSASTANNTVSRQIVAPFTVYNSDCYINQTIGAHSWKVYSTTKGCPIPVWGVTFDLCVCKSLRFTKADGTDKTDYTNDFDYATDCQINQMHGLWWPEGGSDYVSRALLPNGDNWGGAANKSNQKYIFRDTQNWSLTTANTLCGKERKKQAQVRETCSGSNDGKDKTWTIKAFIKDNAPPPARSIFMGITFQMAWGNWGDAGKSHMYYISNLGIITKAARDIMLNQPKYHGQNPSTDGLPHIVLPPLVSKQSVQAGNVKFYGPMQNW